MSSAISRLKKQICFCVCAPFDCPPFDFPIVGARVRVRARARVRVRRTFGAWLEFGFGFRFGFGFGFGLGFGLGLGLGLGCEGALGAWLGLGLGLGLGSGLGSGFEGALGASAEGAWRVPAEVEVDGALHHVAELALAAQTPRLGEVEPPIVVRRLEGQTR